MTIPRVSALKVEAGGHEFGTSSWHTARPCLKNRKKKKKKEETAEGTTKLNKIQNCNVKKKI